MFFRETAAFTRRRRLSCPVLTAPRMSGAQKKKRNNLRETARSMGSCTWDNGVERQPRERQRKMELGCGRQQCEL